MKPVLSNSPHKWRFGSPPKPSAKSYILCVDEDEGLLRLRKAVLEEAGYGVLNATAGAQALELLSGEAQVSLVLSGHMLRGITGTALAGEMKKIKPYVPVVLYCGTLPDSMNNVDGFINNEESRANFLALIAGFVRSCRERLAG